MTTQDGREKLRLIDWVIIFSIVALFFALRALFPEFFQRLGDIWREVSSAFRHGEPGWIRITP